MKETVKINLSQRLFDLDAGAYQALKNYLDSLKSYFRRSPSEAEEIIQDIEQRIADILEEKMSGTKQVVTLKDINEIIAMMGTAKDFAEEEDAPENEKSTSVKQKKTGKTIYTGESKRFYRDIDNNILGGVCSGLAIYLNVDPLWIRLAFVALFFLKGIGLITYIILWLVVPAASSIAQKLVMRGKPVNIDSIEEAVKEGFRNVKENIHQYSKSESFRRTQGTLAEIFVTMGHLFVSLLKVAIIIAGIILAIIGVTFVISFFTGFTGFGFHNFNFPQFHVFDRFLPYFHHFSLFTLALIIVIVVPVFAILFGIIRFVFNTGTHNVVLSAFAWTFWALALVLVILTFASHSNVLSYDNKVRDEVTLDFDYSRVLYLTAEGKNLTSHHTEHYSLFGNNIIHDKSEDRCYLNPKIFIEPSAGSYYKLVLERSKSVPSFNDRDDLNDIHYNWNLTDTLLVLDKYFDLSDEDIWQIPAVKVTLFVPVESKIFISDELKEMMGVEKGYRHEFQHEKFNKALRMGSHGLEGIYE